LRPLHTEILGSTKSVHTVGELKMSAGVELEDGDVDEAVNDAQRLMRV